MLLEVAKYRGRKKWQVSLDHMTPVTVRAPDPAAALVRACVYYNLDWTQTPVRERFKVWVYVEEPADE